MFQQKKNSLLTVFFDFLIEIIDVNRVIRFDISHFHWKIIENKEIDEKYKKMNIKR